MVSHQPAPRAVSSGPEITERTTTPSRSRFRSAGRRFQGGRLLSASNRCTSTILFEENHDDDPPGACNRTTVRDPGAASALDHVRVSFRWLGVRKTLTPEQKTEAALSFGAEGEFLSARKKLLDTRHPAYQEVTAVRGKVLAYWKAMTLPYPEPGIRLLRHSEVEAF